MKNAASKLEGLEIRALEVSEVEEVVDVLARGMRDNPLHFVAFGEDAETRRRRVRAFVSSAFSIKDFSQTLVAHDADGKIVGVCGMMLPGDCLPTPTQKLRMLPTLVVRLGPRAVGRMMGWLGAWSKHDPSERHWHLGPVAVEANWQGMGIGSELMRAFTARMDAAGEDSYLETDKVTNVRFYERFGFEIVGEKEVLGIPNWFMARRAERRF